MNNKLIDRNELKTKIDRQDRFALLEALPPKYFEQGHLPGARQIAFDKIDAAAAAAVIEDKATEVVVYCASTTCPNSDVAARRLAQLGYQNVRVYKGGKADWADAGWSLAQPS